MPDLTDNSSQPKQWQQEGTDSGALPSFYSPRTQLLRGDQDVEPAQLDAPDQASSAAHPAPPPPPAPPAPLAPLAPQQPSETDAQASLPSLPSLLSPSFTPPSTPGTATPLTSLSNASRPSAAAPGAPEPEPRGIPVDSSLPSGGCGNKRPRLLETLPQVECIVRARIPTVHGTQMFLHLYTNNVDNKEHLAIVFGDAIRSRSLDAVREGETEMDRLVRGAYVGRLFPGRTSSAAVEGVPEAYGSAAASPAAGSDPAAAVPPLVRIHSECYTGETVWSARCDCGEQLDEAARLMAQTQGGGVIVYLRQEGRGIGLGEKLKAYNLQDLGSDTVQANLLLRHPADARSYGLATAMLLDLGLREVRLLTNNPDKIRAVEGPNREVVVKERVAMVPKSWKDKDDGFTSPEVNGYLRTKIEKMGHMLDMGAMPR